MNTLEQIKNSNTTLLLGVLIHDRKLSTKTKEMIKQELKERKALT